jgi:hypothetical protein
MPRKPIDYSKSIFYKLVCRDISTTDIYVGSTTDFKSRKSEHKSISRNEKVKGYNIRLYEVIRENGGWDNWEMILIDRHNCIDSLEAHKMERHYFEILGATLNSNTPSRTKQEWAIDNADKVARSKELNKEHAKELRVARESINKDERKELRLSLYKTNNAEFLAKKAIYREANKEAINENQRRYRASKKLLKQESLGVLI